jgi:hypothetical protein
LSINPVKKKSINLVLCVFFVGWTEFIFCIIYWIISHYHSNKIKNMGASNKIKNMGYQSSILAISLGLSLYNNETEKGKKTNT